MVARVRTFVRDWQGILALLASPIAVGVLIAMARPVVEPIAAGVVSDSLAPVRRQMADQAALNEFLSCAEVARQQKRDDPTCLQDFMRARNTNP